MISWILSALIDALEQIINSKKKITTLFITVFSDISVCLLTAILFLPFSKVFILIEKNDVYSLDT